MSSGSYLKQEANTILVPRKSLKRTFIFMIFLIVFPSCTGSPPPNPVRCWSPNNMNCTITNTYGAFPDRTTCHAAQVAYPSSEEDLVSIVGAATLKKQKMKVVTRSSHSMPKLVCVDGQDGLLISTRNLNGVMGIDVSDMTMTVESGMLLRDLINEAAKVGLALPYTPYWWGLTVGGLLGTGAHGSTLWGKGSAVHDYVVGVRIVTPAGPDQGYAVVRTLNEEDGGALNAARVSLGVLGVISQVTFKMQPMFKRSITYVTKDDTDLGDQAAHFGRQHEFADLQWYPSQRKVVYRVDDRVSSSNIISSANGVYDSTGFRSILSLTVALIRSTEEGQESRGDADGKCISGRLTTSTLSAAGYGLTNNGNLLFMGYPVVGYQNRLQSSGSCLNSHEDALMTVCPWDHRVKGLFFHQTGVSIALSKVKHFIQDVQKLVDLAPKALCGLDLNNGILMRYVTHSNAYLGKEEDALDFDITYYRSKDPNTPRLYEDFLEEIEQMAMFKYGGLPHWGKNRNVVFEGVINKYKSAAEFFKVKDMFDPLGLFSSEWTDQVLGLKRGGGVSIVKEGCALEGLCICSLDIHCAPNKGYFCRPGKIYEDARVCTHLSSKTP